MTEASEWRRVTQKNPCPICNRPDWCTVTRDAAAACCMRVESPKRLRNGGWLHRLRDDPPRDPERSYRITLNRSPADLGRFRKLDEDFRRRITDGQVVRLADRLGVSTDSLQRLHVGFNGTVYTFPMRDADGEIIGIRTRTGDGQKRCVKGSKLGLFVPTGLSPYATILVSEGESDCAALLSLGFDAIARPGCRACLPQLRAYLHGRDVVILADADGPGMDGARHLARRLVLACRSVRIIPAPADAKDIREAVNSGATREDVQAAIDGARRLIPRLSGTCHG